MFSFLCKHEWKLVSEATTKSPFETTVETLRGAFTDLSKVSIPWQLCDETRYHIQVVACSKCGKLKRFVQKV